MSPIEKIQGGTYRLVAPAGTQDVHPKHKGRLEKKPWDFGVSVCIPHLNTIEPLKLVVELLRLQTERPYIMVMDTGSEPDVQAQLELMRDGDLEVHRISAHGWRHSSEPVTAALDLAHSLCRTKHLFHTHADCFLRRRDFLETLVRMANCNTPAVGYKMSPRDWIKGAEDWEWMVGHVALMLYMPSIERIGATWSMSRAHYAFGVPWHVDGGWPDTEVGFNHCLRSGGIKPLFIGFDRNFENQIDDNLQHVRSFTGGKLYSPEHYATAQGWMQQAMEEARKRIAAWQAC